MDELHFTWEDDKKENIYYLRFSNKEEDFYGSSSYLIKIIENDKKVWEEPKWIAYLNHDFLAQLLFPTDCKRTRIELMMMILPDDILEAKKILEGQVLYSLRKRKISFPKTRQQKIDEQLDES